MVTIKTQKNNSFKSERVTANHIKSRKAKGDKITVLTAYDYPTAYLCDKAGIDLLLVGDSAAMVVLGYSNTLSVAMNDMLLFCGAVARATKRSMITADMPFGSYQMGISQALRNAIRFIKSGCDSVKLEGGIEIVETVKALVDAGIPVMGHIGLKPQTSVLWDSYRVQGKTETSALQLIRDAQSLEQAGVFSMVLEMVTSEVAELISSSVSVPTIGIGSGCHCDGQVLVLHDILGLYEAVKPKFVKQYADLSAQISNAIGRYMNDVKAQNFPAEKNTFHMAESEYIKLKNTLGSSSNGKK